MDVEEIANLVDCLCTPHQVPSKVNDEDDQCNIRLRQDQWCAFRHEASYKAWISWTQRKGLESWHQLDCIPVDGEEKEPEEWPRDQIHLHLGEVTDDLPTVDQAVRWEHEKQCKARIQPCPICHGEYQPKSAKVEHDWKSSPNDMEASCRQSIEDGRTYLQNTNNGWKCTNHLLKRDVNELRHERPCVRIDILDSPVWGLITSKALNEYADNHSILD